MRLECGLLDMENSLRAADDRKFRRLLLNLGITDMSSMPQSETTALIIGAGPVGLTMACELLRQGVPCRIVEQNEGPTPLTQSRALAIQARTMEALENVGATEHIVAHGRKVHGINGYHGGRRIVHLTLDLDALDTSYPFLFTLPQGQTERILIDVLKSRGGTVEWRTQMTGLQNDASIRATLKGPDGTEQTVSARWLIGCDGARSTVRRELHLPFQGTEYEETFCLADVRIDWQQQNDEATVIVDKGIQVGAFPLPEPGRWRLVDASESVGTDDPAQAVERFQDLLNSHGFPKARVSDPGWVSSFRVHRRVVDRFRVGSCLLAGDAAHIHSPAGGQGMNTGIQEACNLAWKLGLIHAGVARDPEGLLDSYAAERRPIALDVLRGTDLATRAITVRNPLLESLRNRLASFLSEFDFVRQRISVGISELGINYRRSPIVAEDGPGAVGLHAFPGPRAGDRVPDVALDPAANEGTARLFDRLRGTGHHLLLFEGDQPSVDVDEKLGALARQVRDRAGAWIEPQVVIAAASRRGTLSWDGRVILDVDRSLHHRFGAGATCLYLTRPDGYVGYRSQPIDAERLWTYLHRIFVTG
jgi:2-polyprenyl-6-methoxyphenol hydroxylase-like FAD-dependent oxidoreductase